MTTQQVANNLVKLCREGKHKEAVQELYSPEIVSVEPEGTPNSVSDPIVAEKYFSCSMLMNVQMKGAPVAIDMDEICVYTVNEGKIVREEFFHTPQPQMA